MVTPSPRELWVIESDTTRLPITTGKLGFYPNAIRRIHREGELTQTATHRTSKYLNNIIEADHGGIKRVIRPTVASRR